VLGGLRARPAAFSTKVCGSFEHDGAVHFQGFIALSDIKTGEPIGILDSMLVTIMRTATRRAKQVRMCTGGHLREQRWLALHKYRPPISHLGRHARQGTERRGPRTAHRSMVSWRGRLSTSRRATRVERPSKLRPGFAA
jgi:hypothetical protein